MVLRYSKNGFPYRTPPYSKKEIAQIEAEGFYATPTGIIRAGPRGERPQKTAPQARPIEAGENVTVQRTETTC